MANNALDTLSLARSLEQSGMPRNRAEGIAAAAGNAVSASGSRPREVADALAGSGLPAAVADALATLFSKLDLPKAGAVVDTISLARKLEAAGMRSTEAGVLLTFLYERWPARWRTTIFSTVHTARALAYAGLPETAAEALTRIICDTRQGKAPDTLTIARNLATAGVIELRAEAIARCLLLVSTRSDQSNLSDLLTAGLTTESAGMLRDAVFHAITAGLVIDTRGIANILRSTGIRPAAVDAFADVCLDVAATAVGAVVGSLSLSRKLANGGIPLPQAMVIAGVLYRFKTRSLHPLPHAAVIAEALEAARFDPDDARGFALAIRRLASWRPT